LHLNAACVTPGLSTRPTRVSAQLLAAVHHAPLHRQWAHGEAQRSADSPPAEGGGAPLVAGDKRCVGRAAHAAAQRRLGPVLAGAASPPLARQLTRTLCALTCPVTTPMGGPSGPSEAQCLACRDVIQGSPEWCWPARRPTAPVPASGCGAAGDCARWCDHPRRSFCLPHHRPARLCHPSSTLRR